MPKPIKFSAAEIVKKVRKINDHTFHWKAADVKLLIRARTGPEYVLMAQEMARVEKDMLDPELKDTADEPTALDLYRIRLRYAIPCLYDPESGEEMFAENDVDELMTLPIPALNELFAECDRVSNFTKEQVEETGKNSVETGDAKSSSVSPPPAETPTSSPIPASSTTA